MSKTPELQTRKPPEGGKAKTILIASDHRGLKAKEEIKAIIRQLGLKYIDKGTSDSMPVDYPDFAYIGCKGLVDGEANQAILICSTGMDMCMVANKMKGIRATLCHDEMSARAAREQKNANVLCVSGDMVNKTTLRAIVEAWLETSFAGGRHQRRLNKIKAIEEGKSPLDD